MSIVKFEEEDHLAVTARIIDAIAVELVQKRELSAAIIDIFAPKI